MSDLIRREDVLDEIYEWSAMGEDRFENAVKAIQERIADIPAAKTEARKKGMWVIDPRDQQGYCSVCKCDMPMMMEDWEYKTVATEYCPSCGAYMVNNDREEEQGDGQGIAQE